MFLEDLSSNINYLAVVIAALVYFILGAIWYAPGIFGNRWTKHEEGRVEEHTYAYKIGAYIGEFILDLIIAYVLALFLLLSQATEIVEGVILALWIWVGFIATTHFSAVLWGRKTVKSFFIHACFMLIGVIAMAIVLLYLS